MQKWLVGDVPLKVNFLVKVNHPLVQENASYANKQRNTIHILLASQLLQCSVKCLTMPINETQLRHLDAF